MKMKDIAKKSLVLFFLLYFMVVPPVESDLSSWTPTTWVFNSPSDFLPYVRVLTFGASVSAGQVSGSSLDYNAIKSYASWSYNTSAQYYQYTFNVTAPSQNYVALELDVPDSYMGLDIYEGATLMTGNTTRYALSVPYLWNATSVTAYDWGSLALGTPSGSYGTLKRVQLVLNMTASEQRTVTVKIKYTSTPSIGFDGVNDYVSCGDVLSGMPNFTIALRAMATRWNKYYNLFISKHYGGINGEWYLAFFPSNIRLTHINSTPNRLDFTVNYTFNLNTWYYLAGSYDGSELRLYVNGQLIGSTPRSGVTQTTENPLFVGWYAGPGSGYQHIGFINDVFIYNRALSSTDIQQLYQGTYTNTTGLVLWISANSWNGTHFVDLSGNGNHGTPYGNVQYKVWTQNGFSTTYVGDPTNQQSMNTIATAMLPYCSPVGTVDVGIGSVNYTYVNVGTLYRTTNINPNGTTFLNFTGNTFYLLSGAKTYTTNITSGVFWLQPNATINNWMVTYDSVNKTLVLKASPPYQTPQQFFDIGSMIGFYQDAWGIGTYVVMMLVPISVYLKTRSYGLFASTMLFIAAARFSLEQNMISFAYLGVALAISAMLYLILRGKS
jgi:hypothetical protein